MAAAGAAKRDLQGLPTLGTWLWWIPRNLALVEYTTITGPKASLATGNQLSVAVYTTPLLLRMTIMIYYDILWRVGLQ